MKEKVLVNRQYKSKISFLYNKSCILKDDELKKKWVDALKCLHLEK